MTYHISVVGLLFAITVNTISGASSLSSSDAASLNSLYDNLLQREYAGPISFPDHQVERKAQRSPSLRLRFGRSDSSMPIVKRWFGDVNQKPIRSPSLRLRFGKRDEGLQGLEGFNAINDFEPGFARQDRKPSGRLRWGRSLPFEDLEIGNQQTRNEEISMGTESLQALLNALREVDDNELSSREFTREIRKPAPLRLRWGRSTGSAPSTDNQKLHDSAREQSISNNGNENLSTTKTV